jgi:serine/threonine protein kinase/tetratricopeptide (TPR) repeat protein
MGVVYAAEQVRPVRRRVALKMLKAGVYSKEVLARFEAERQALAVMEHPGIAKVLDAGISDSGRPYFVMELVRGIRIDEYCDRNRLTIRARAELFIQLCMAVQHAHQKGVIHRDLKPSNILVTEQDGTPVPKIIDFGIAKATGQRLTDATMMTSLGLGIGTLAYMSPEQAEGSELDVDTRADIYSLGIILYQLLTDRPPMDPKQTGMPSFLATLVSRDESMPNPAQRFTSLDVDAQRDVANSRRAEVGELRKMLRGDLGWIVMRAIEKDRRRRYETANGLALELGRYLASEPVLARPPSARYRLARFANRHRAAVVLGGVAVLALVLGTIAASVGLVRARRAENAAQAEQVRAEREAETAQQVTSFLVDLFEVSDPSEAHGSAVTAREILDRGATRVERELSDRPLVQARMMAVMGTVYTGLGLYDDALPLLGRALDIRTKNLPADDPQIAASLDRLGNAQRNRGDLEAAEANLRRALAIREQAFGPHDDLVAHSLLSLGEVFLARSRLAEADSLLERALAIEEADVGEQHLEEATILQDLGSVSYYRGEYGKASQLYERAIALRQRRTGPNDPWLGNPLNNLGGVHFQEGRYDQALSDYKRAEEIWSAALGPDHPRVASALTNIAEAYTALGRYDEAEPIARRALSIKERNLSPNAPSIAVTLRVLGDVYSGEGRYGDAEPRYQRAIEIVESVYGADHPRLGEYLDAYARMLREAGRTDEAEQVEARRAALGGGG